jgi:hypothetical protein
VRANPSANLDAALVESVAVRVIELLGERAQADA